MTNLPATNPNETPAGTVASPSMQIPVVETPDDPNEITSVHPSPDVNPGNPQAKSAADPRPGLPMYTYSDWDKGPDGTGLDPGPDRAVWKDCAVQTTGGERLLTFINDMPNQPPTVNDPRFTPYTGETEPIPEMLP